MSGILSDSLSKLESGRDRFAAIKNLPPDAVAIQDSIISMIAQVLLAALTLQQGTSQYAQAAKVKLDDIQTRLTKTSESLTSIKVDMDKVKDSTDVQRGYVEDSCETVQKYSKSMLEEFNKIYGIINDLTLQLNKATSERDAAKGKEAAAKKRYYYLLALGPFGVAGLAAALALYKKWSSQVRDYEDEVNSLNRRIASLNTMRSSCDDLRSMDGTLSADLSSVQDVLELLGADMLIIDEDLGSEQPRVVVSMKVMAAISEIANLEDELA